MSKSKSKNLKIETDAGIVSGIFEVPTRIVAGLTLAHGAGAGMNHEFMASLASALTDRGFAVLRYQFPYMENGKKRPDRPPVAMATVAAVVDELRRRVAAAPIFAAGKSFGSRMTTTAASQGLLDPLAGIICYGFPLHTAGEPEVKRAEHLANVLVPTLFLQGTRDELADLNLMREVCSDLPRATLHAVQGADHGFAVLKRSGRTSKQVMGELADESLRFALQNTK